MQQQNKREQDENEISNEITHVLLHNLDDVNSAIILFKIGKENVLKSILTFLKTKLGKVDFEFFNIFSEKIEMINMLNRRIYFQEKKNEMKNNEELAKSIDAFTQREKYHQDPEEKYEKQNRQEGQIYSFQQLKQEEQQLDQQNYNMQKNKPSRLKILSPGYEQKIRQYQIEIQIWYQKLIILSNIYIQQSYFRQSNQYNINQLQEENQQLQEENYLLQIKVRETNFNYQSQIEALNTEKQENKQSTQYNNNNKLQEENQKLKNENILLQKELKEIKVKLQSQMQELIKERNDSKINPKIQIINQNPILEPKKNEQVQSYYQNQNQQLNNYRNKCGHYIDISQIQNQIYQALRGNKIALCNSCQNPLQSKLCLLIQDCGKFYLETKIQIELKQLLSNLERGKLKNNEKLVKCQNNNCQFFCIWQIQKSYSGRFQQQNNGFCPICLQQSILSQEKQALIYSPKINYSYNKAY